MNDLIMDNFVDYLAHSYYSVIAHHKLNAKEWKFIFAQFL
jgi:hypothetical protein